MKSFRLQVSSLLFYFLILFLPTQLGRHFWPDFSFASGIRVDYLSPTLYLTDILILSLFIVWVLGVCHRERSVAISLRGLLRRSLYSLLAMTTNLKYSKFVALVVFVVFLMFGILLSKNQLAGLFGLIRLLEFIFLGFYTAGNIKRLSFDTILLLFSIGIISESFLAILQYLNQTSMGGIFYFLGERSFNSQTPGIANASINGNLVLRPYGTFSHPNVLAGYLTIAMAMIISNIKYQISNIKKITFLVSLAVGTLTLFLTMSRVAIVLWFIIIGFQVITYAIKKLKNASPMIHNPSSLIRLLVVLVFIGSIGSIFSLSPLHFRFTDIKLSDESIVERGQLIKDSLLMIKDHPIFGVGLNNFLVELPNVYKQSGNVFYLQPVHNIYLLILSQTGIVGLMFFAWFIIKTYRRIMNHELEIRDKKSIIHNSKFIILSTVLVLGLFDHYFLTLQQGQLLFSFILGLCWSGPSKGK